MAKGLEKSVLYRVVKFEVELADGELELLLKVSSNLKGVWNEALAARQRMHEQFIVPLLAALKEAGERKDAHAITTLKEELKGAYSKHRITFFDQVNALTPRRNVDSDFASVQRNWQEETLDTLNGAYSSFLALRKNGDPKARPPRLRSELDFGEISGRSGFKTDGKSVTLSCGKIANGVMLTFAIPDYQQEKLTHAIKVKKFTLYRDESDLCKPGRFWISLAYEIEKPETKPFNPREAVYIALGSSSIGIVSPKGEEVLPLWRSDKHWKPLVDQVGEREKLATKGSCKWLKRNAAKLKMFRIMAAQQRQNRREIVALDLLLVHGVHFVVSDLVVRSKKGKLADAKKPERGGALGLNWSAQNTGALAYLVQWLEEKAKEQGGTVRKHKLTQAPFGLPKGHENKIPMARALRDDFLKSLGT